MRSAPDRAATAGEIAVRAILYALAIAALVIFAPGGDHVFIYQGF
jgi:hypothetical protein